MWLQLFACGFCHDFVGWRRVMKQTMKPLCEELGKSLSGIIVERWIVFETRCCSLVGFLNRKSKVQTWRGNCNWRWGWVRSLIGTPYLIVGATRCYCPARLYWEFEIHSPCNTFMYIGSFKYSVSRNLEHLFTRLTHNWYYPFAQSWLLEIVFSIHIRPEHR